MSEVKRQRGRPNLNSEDAREALILAARKCFASRPFREVTTRMVAQEAGVNAALIRYYFVNKDGLYQQTLDHVAQEFRDSVLKFVEEQPDNPLEAILRAHASIAMKNPDIPRLIFKEMVFNEGHGRQLVLDNVAKPNRNFLMGLVNNLATSGQLREDFDPSIFIMSALSMSIVPHLLKDSMMEVEGRTMDDQLIEKMIWQNAEMMKYGSFKPEKE